MSRVIKKKNIFMSVGAPMLGFILMGYGMLTVFMQNHYEQKDALANSKTSRVFSLDEEHSKMLKNLV